MRKKQKQNEEESKCTYNKNTYNDFFADTFEYADYVALKKEKKQQKQAQEEAREEAKKQAAEKRYELLKASSYFEVK